MDAVAEKLALTQKRVFSTGAVGDRLFKWLALVMSLTVFVLIALIGYELAHGSSLALRKFGWQFLTSSN